MTSSKRLEAGKLEKIGTEFKLKATIYYTSLCIGKPDGIKKAWSLKFNCLHRKDEPGFINIFCHVSF